MILTKSVPRPVRDVFSLRSTINGLEWHLRVLSHYLVGVQPILLEFGGFDAKIFKKNHYLSQNRHFIVNFASQHHRISYQNHLIYQVLHFL